MVEGVSPPPPVILEKTIRIPRSLSVKAAQVLKGFLNKVRNRRVNLLKRVVSAHIQETGFCPHRSGLTTTQSF